MIFRKFGLIGLILLLILPVASINAQSPATLQCGDIVEGEVLPGSGQADGNTERGHDNYVLDIQAGTRINLTVEPLGNTFNAGFALLDAGGNDVLQVNEDTDGKPEQLVDYQIGSSNQTLRVVGMPPGHIGSSGFYNPGLGGSGAGYYFGAYELRLGCTLRDGTIIEP